jgi:hypothetical protein
MRERDKVGNTKLRVTDENIVDALKLVSSHSPKLAEKGKRVLEIILGKSLTKQVLKGEITTINEIHKVFRSARKDNDSRGLPD